MRDSEEFLERIENLRVMRNKSYRAPHKPLLLLLALGRVHGGSERLESYSAIEPLLKNLLAKFGPWRKVLHPEQPFGHLRTDELWEVPGGEELPTTSKGTFLRAGLVKNSAKGGLPERHYNALKANPDLVRQAAALLLDKHFPRSLHAGILEAVMLPAIGLSPLAQATKRARAFRRDILDAYEKRCAACGFDLTLGDQLVALDAAHIKWHSCDGPDIVPNGLALCAAHHEAFDRGAFGLGQDMEDGGYRMIMSPLATASAEAGRRFLRHQGEKIQVPKSAEHAPKDEFVRWHRRNVFKGSARSAAGRS